MSFGRVEQTAGDARAAMSRIDVDLFDLVIDRDKEAGDLAIDFGTDEVIDSIVDASSERLCGSFRQHPIRDVAEVAVAPARVPDSCDRFDFGRQRSADQQGLRPRMMAPCRPGPTSWVYSIEVSDRPAAASWAR